MKSLHFALYTVSKKGTNFISLLYTYGKNSKNAKYFISCL